MDQMNQKERDMLEESFSLYDTIGDHKIDITLLGEVLRGLGLNPTEGDVQKVIRELDSSGSKRITYEEFLPIYESLLSRGENRGKKSGVDFLEAFRVFDREQNGTVSVGELAHVMTTLGEGLTSDEVNSITQGMEDKDGMINIEDFVKTVMNG